MAPSLATMENTSQTSAAIDESRKETDLCHPDKKRKHFSELRIAGFIRKFPERSEYFAKDSLFFEKYTDILEKRRTCPEMVSFSMKREK